jgi:hypothetical protein
MRLMTATPPPIVDDMPALPMLTARKTRNSVAGSSTLYTGLQANPRRIRLTAPGNPVHR